MPFKHGIIPLMLKIKLSRTGRKNQPSYRVVVAEARSKRDGKVVDNLGYYNPLSKSAEVVIDKKKFQEWISRGAKPTITVEHLYKKA